MTEFLTEFGLRDWLLVLGPVFIAGILLHGYWRMQNSRNSIKMSLDKKFISEAGDALDEPDELSMLRAELPNGGARVRTVPEQTKLNLEENVPVLMDPVDEPGQAKVEASDTSVSATRTSRADLSDTPAISANRQERTTATRTVPEQKTATQQTSAPARKPLPANLPEKYVVLNVMAIGEPFDGQALLECLVELDMTFGEMNIFHRMGEGDETLFSLMNAVEPGSFDLGDMASVSTPALSMFMRVHELHDPCGVFEQMLHVAQRLAEELGGELRDESRSVMTTQTIQHCQQELQEYKLKNHR